MFGGGRGLGEGGRGREWRVQPLHLLPQGIPPAGLSPEGVLPVSLFQAGAPQIHPYQQQLHRTGGPSGSPVQVKQEPLPSLVYTSNFSKPRLQWTPELHDLFVNAVNQLGGHETATPKAISKIMCIEGLTLYQIKSHLQKYRHKVVLGGEGAVGRAEEQAGGDAEGPIANPSMLPARENEVVNEKAVEEKENLDEELGDAKIEEHVRKHLDAQDRCLKLARKSAPRLAQDINPRESLSQNEPQQFSLELKQHYLWPSTHSRKMVRTHTDSSSPPQEFAHHSSTENDGGEWNRVVQELEVDPAKIYLNFQDDAGEDENI